MLLTPRNLGRVIRFLIKCRYRFLYMAGYDINVDTRDLRRIWSLDNNGRSRVGLRTMMMVLDRLGYEIHFTITRKAGTK
jgi:hypothetical protein